MKREDALTVLVVGFGIGALACGLLIGAAGEKWFGSRAAAVVPGLLALGTALLAVIAIIVALDRAD